MNTVLRPQSAALKFDNWKADRAGSGRAIPNGTQRQRQLDGSRRAIRGKGACSGSVSRSTILDHVVHDSDRSRHLASASEPDEDCAARWHPAALFAHSAALIIVALHKSYRPEIASLLRFERPSRLWARCRSYARCAQHAHAFAAPRAFPFPTSTRARCIRATTIARLLASGTIALKGKPVLMQRTALAFVRGLIRQVPGAGCQRQLDRLPRPPQKPAPWIETVVTAKPKPARQPRENQSAKNEAPRIQSQQTAAAQPKPEPQQEANAASPLASPNTKSALPIVRRLIC
jgi:hypothetical protein